MRMRLQAVPRGRRGSRLAEAFATALLLVAVLAVHPAFGWGLEGHRIVTEAAVDRIPEPLHAFFLLRRGEVIEQSLAPDKILKQQDPGERIRHYIDIEELESEPFTSLPRDAAEAEKLFGKRRLKKAGLLPWAIEQSFDDLKEAFEAGDAAAIALRAGRLAHYVADAHQPLHLTKDFDGRGRCNAGIHSAFETFLVERNAAAYREAVSKGAVSVVLLGDPFEATLAWMRETYPLRTEILKADEAALRALKTRGGDYYKTLERGAGAIAHSRMSAAANAVGSMWLTAWVRAGRPELPAPTPAKSR